MYMVVIAPNYQSASLADRQVHNIGISPTHKVIGVTRTRLEDAKCKALAMLRDAQIALTEEEQDSMEVVDLGLGNIGEMGLQIVVYVDTGIYYTKTLWCYPGRRFLNARTPQ